MLLYEKASRRRREIFREGEHDDLTLLARCHQRYRLKREFADELDELAAYQGHLRSTIIRLRCKPIQRFKYLMHIACSRFAFSRSLGSYFLSLALLIIGFHFADEPAWAQEMQTGFVSHLLWTPFDARLLYANLMAASVVAVVLPLLYFLQRAKLHGDHRMQLRMLKEFAGADPDSLIHQPRADQDRHENAQSDRSAYQSRGMTMIGMKRRPRLPPGLPTKEPGSMSWGLRHRRRSRRSGKPTECKSSRTTPTGFTACRRFSASSPKPRQKS